MPASQKSTKQKGRSLNLVDYIVRVLARIPPEQKSQKKRDFGERVLGILFFDKDPSPDKDKQKEARKIGTRFEDGEETRTTEQIVAILSRLYRRINNREGIEFERKVLEIPAALPTGAQILRTFQLLIQLTPEELDRLHLPEHAQHPLLQQAFLNLASYRGNDALDRILAVYRASIQGNDIAVNPLKEKQAQTLQEIYVHLDSLINDKQESEKIKRTIDRLQEKPIRTLEDVHAHIDLLISGKQESERIKRAVDRLLLQAATGQVRFLEIADQNQYIQEYLTREFLNRFVKTVQANNALSQDFPIYLKNISLEPAGPFPLLSQGNNPERNPLHSGLLTLQYPTTEKRLHASSDHLFDQLPSRNVSKITCDFYIRICKKKNGDWEDYPGFSEGVRRRMATEMTDQKRVHFSIISTGIGGTNSHMTKLINIAVLNDVDCLRTEYSSMAHDDFLETKIINAKVASPVWAHSFVHLCHNKAIIQALQSSTEEKIARHDQFGASINVGQGDYCDFDVLTAAAKSALQARLQALYNTGISAKQYINDVLVRVEKEYILEEAEALVSSYPFSSFALESWINRELLSKEDNLQLSYVSCKAYLLIAEALLNEGVYRKAYPYVEWLQQKLGRIATASITWLDSYGETAIPEVETAAPKNVEDQQDGENQQAGTSDDSDSAESQESLLDDDFEAFSGSLLASYEICIAQYFYTLDWQRENTPEGKKYFLGRARNINQDTMIRESWEALERAEKHLTIRMARYHAVDEISQAAFRPYYYILCKIYLLRAKLFIWFAPLVPPANTVANTIVYKPPTYGTITDRSAPQNFCGARLFLLERARVYAACDGNDKLYVICTAYQCWVWLMTKFLGRARQPLLLRDKRGGNHKTLEIKRSDCLLWAKQLRNHALLSYDPIGRHCYHEIKEKSGLSEELTQSHTILDTYEIEPVPLIKEIIGEEKPGFRILSNKEEGFQEETPVLYLNMQYLLLERRLVDPDNPYSTQSIYLFGPAACYLFFIRGLYHLCSDDKQEFSDEEEKLESLEDWDKKFEECYRLFNYAWAIADDGCTIDQTVQNENGPWKIERYAQQSYKDISDADAASVWDLYPLRVTEIADAGKIFAAACAALRYYTCDDREARGVEIKELLDRLHNQLSFENSIAFKTALNGQERYNGHLELYISKCVEAINRCRERADNTEVDMRKKRNGLFEKMFSYDAL